MSFAARLAQGLLQGASGYYRELAVQQDAERRRLAAAGAVAMREQALERLRAEGPLPATELAVQEGQRVPPAPPAVSAANALQAHEGLHRNGAAAAAGMLSDSGARLPQRPPAPSGSEAPRIQLELDDPAAVPEPAPDDQRPELAPAPALELADSPPGPPPARAPRREQARAASGRAILPRSEFESGLSALMKPGVTEADLLGYARRNGYRLDPARVRYAVRTANDYDRSDDWLTGTIRINEARAAAERAAPRIVPASDLIVVDPHAMAYNREMTAWIAAHPNATARQISDASRALGRARYEDRYMIAVEAAQPYVDYRRGGGRYTATVVAGPGIAHRADRFTGHENDQWNASNAKAALDASSDGHGNIDLDRLAEQTRPTLADSVIKGVTTLRRGGGAFTEAVGELTGAQGLADYGREVRERNSAILAVVPEGSRVADIRNFGDALQWAKEVVGENAIVMAPGVGGAAIGGRLLGTWGAVAGAFVPSEILGVGEAQVQLKNKDPDAKAGAWILVGGTAVAALDSVLPTKVGSQLVRRFGTEAAEAIAIRALTRPVSARMAAALREGGRGARIEGLTEIVQEVVIEYSASAGAGQAPDLASLPGRALEAGARGAFVGFGAGTSSGAARSGRSIDPAAAFDGPEPTARDTNAAAIDALSPDLGEHVALAPRDRVAITQDHPSVHAMVARAAHPQSQLDAFGAAFSAYRSGGVKSRARIAEKVTNEGYGSVTDLKDVARGAFVVDTPEEAERFAAAIRGRFRVVEDKGWVEQRKSGYLDHKIIVRFDNGVRGEIQIVPRPVWDVKQGPGDGLYHQARSSDDERVVEAAQAKERALYASALEGSEFASLSSSSRSALGNSRANSSRERGIPRIADLPTSPGANRHSPESQTQARPFPSDQATPTPRPSTSYSSSLTGSTSSDRLRASNRGDKQGESSDLEASAPAAAPTPIPPSSALGNASKLPTLQVGQRSLVVRGLSKEALERVQSTLPARVRLLQRSDGAYVISRKFEPEARAAFYEALHDGIRAEAKRLLSGGAPPLPGHGLVEFVKPRRSAFTLDEARARAKDYVGRALRNQWDNLPATASNASLKKMTSESAVRKSTNASDHALAVANADKLYAVARRVESKPDSKGSRNLAGIHRYVSLMLTEGRVVRVTLTVKETTSSKEANKLYTLEGVEVD